MSRKCSHAIAQIYTYIDGELTWTRRTWVRWHLWRCRDCLQSFTFEERLKETIRRGCVDEVPPELYDRLHTFLQQHGPEGPGGTEV
ncbi:MAG: zf-HC2 domain-containing protein [Acidimicrobiia bacterium]